MNTYTAKIATSSDNKEKLAAWFPEKSLDIYGRLVVNIEVKANNFAEARLNICRMLTELVGLFQIEELRNVQR